MILDLFAGAGGAGSGFALAAPGEEVLGIEIDPVAAGVHPNCLTGDVRDFVAPERPRPINHLHGSPPCTTISKAGSGRGRPTVERLLPLVKRVLSGEDIDTCLSEIEHDSTAALMLEPARYMHDLWPETISLEQTREAAVMWTAYAQALDEQGYETWTGVLHAEQYGVPQTRRRAWLMASRVGPVVAPTPTHSKYHERTPSRLDPDVAPWVSMAAALGWGMTARPYMTITGARHTGGPDGLKLGGASSVDTVVKERDEGRWALGFPRKADEHAATPEGYRERDLRSLDKPSFALTGKVRSWRFHNHSGEPFDEEWPFHRPSTTLPAWRDMVQNPGQTANRYNKSNKSRNDGIRITVAEAAVLQGFPADYPFKGTQTKQFRQIGNAVPPPVAKAVLEALR